jgi:hypothetical protein
MQDKSLDFEIYFYCNPYGRVVNSQGKFTLKLLQKQYQRQMGGVSRPEIKSPKLYQGLECLSV